MADLLAIVAAFVVLWPLISALAQGKFDIYDYWNWFSLGVVVLLVQDGQARTWIFERFGEDQAAYAFALLLGSIVIFRIIYRSGLGEEIARLLPAPPRNSPQPLMLKWGAFFCLLGVVGQVIFVQVSGGFEAFYSVGRGAGDYENNTAYLYGTPNLVYVGMLILLSEMRKPTVTNSTRIMIVLLAAFIMLYKVYIGQRSHVILYSIAFLCIYFSARGRAIPFRLLIPLGVALVIILGFMNLYRGGIHLYTDWGELQKDVAQKSATDFAREATVTGKVAGYGTEVCMYIGITYFCPDPVPYDYGETYLNLLVQWIPRRWWRSRPVFLSSWGKLLEAHGTGATHGPTPTMFGLLYMNGGVVGMITGSFLLAVIMSILPKWHGVYPENDYVRVFWVGLMFEPWFWVLINGIPCTVVNQGPWFLMPMVLVFAFSRARVEGPVVSVPRPQNGAGPPPPPSKGFPGLGAPRPFFRRRAPRRGIGGPQTVPRSGPRHPPIQQTP